MIFYNDKLRFVSMTCMPILKLSRKKTIGKATPIWFLDLRILAKKILEQASALSILELIKKLNFENLGAT